MRKTFILATAAALLMSAAGPALADPEPDNWIWQATGPVTSGTISGTIASDNDDDWYMFYAASQTQLSITMKPTSCPSYFTLRTATGSEIDGQVGSSTQPRTMTYTTPLGTTRYFLKLESSSSCNPTYNLSISPVSGLLPGSAMPTATVPMGEPNESAQQALGPLLGDTVYSGALETQNDNDWFSFYANGPFAVTATSGNGCGGGMTLFNEDVSEVDGWSFTSNYFHTITYTPASWQRYYLELTGSCTGSAYRFQITPASSLQSGPAPAPTGPAPMTGLTYRKTRKTVVVYWPGIAGASSYQVRAHKRSKWGAWKATANTWKSYKRKSMPKRMKVQARAVNAVGAGAVQTIKVRR